jgi:murein DD-endopeptidase MepM/ murein hydrolase activator NlpD
MIEKSLRKYIICLVVGIAAFAAADDLRASSPHKIDTIKTQLVIPRPAVDPVKSLYRTAADPVDTLDTAHEYVKVILYGDNTWQYYKTPEYQKTTDVYSDNWNSTTTDPYGLKLSDMPSQWSIWCVDSLDQYHCPYQGDVYHRGKFGMRRGRRHQGVDLPLKTGAPVYATFTGKVRTSRYWGAYGNIVIIRHENGIETFYAHLSERLVEKDQWVNAGDVIGYGGSTGRSTGPHLHFETRYNGYAFDPQWLIDFKTGQLRHRLFVLKKKYFDIYSNYEQDFDDEAKNEEEDKKEDAEREAMRWYTIKSGDTLGGIAYRNNTTVSELCRLNNITTKTVLKIGRKIRVR